MPLRFSHKGFVALTYDDISDDRHVSNGNHNHENGDVEVERDVSVTGRAIEADLDTLQAEIKGQIADLEKCLEQLDMYQQVRG